MSGWGAAYEEPPKPPAPPPGRHRKTPRILEIRHTSREVWGLRLTDDGRILRQGYSERPLSSADDVRKDFDHTVLDRGEPVLLEVISTARYVYDDRDLS